MPKDGLKVPGRAWGPAGTPAAGGGLGLVSGLTNGKSLAKDVRAHKRATHAHFGSASDLMCDAVEEMEMRRSCAKTCVCV